MELEKKRKTRPSNIRYTVNPILDDQDNNDQANQDTQLKNPRTSSLPIIHSAKLIEQFRYKNQKVLLGLSDQLYLAYSENGRDWKWEPKPLNGWSPIDRENEFAIDQAFRSGKHVYAVIRKKSKNTTKKTILILDPECPWKLMEQRTIDASMDFQQEIKNSMPKLTRIPQNPIITPLKKNYWESFTTMNPTALLLDNRVHLLYRAQGPDYVSSIGYASSPDGENFDVRLSQPAFEDLSLGERARRGTASSHYASGGGLGGTEDPRATVIGEKVFMSYVAYDGSSPPRLAITSINVNDFLKQSWRWKRPVYISPSNYVDKSGALFPRKIRGKYAMMHRIFPHIQIDYLDDLNFDGKKFLRTQAVIEASPTGWDSRKIGAGAPPLWTEEGWLLVYYGVDDNNDSHYHMGAMLLDHEYPERVLYRTPHPVISPEAWYENTGFKPGIVYPCGAVIKDDTLLVYYGAADNYVALAKAPLKIFLEQLKRCQDPLVTLNYTIKEEMIGPPSNSEEDITLNVTESMYS